MIQIPTPSEVQENQIKVDSKVIICESYLEVTFRFRSLWTDELEANIDTYV